jgi:hypothetical protein
MGERGGRGYFSVSATSVTTTTIHRQPTLKWTQVNELSGYTARVAQMFNVFDDMEASRFQRNFKPVPSDRFFFSDFFGRETFF